MTEYPDLGFLCIPEEKPLEENPQDELPLI
jgi:hypothetical protein